ncbi:phosphoribosylformylglycinamidine synthase [Taylorella equigenitalis]|uniref:phosphoribosylformylglycinamidine synthase n=1 Tax=Taylorella equigenitalis TaxID=29575 RepID=UPI0003FE56A2|nr:phosphoribosylformylglycinamidine synthase [Taylorella equigenitalis]ASY37704.1 phosphoribosylformylglycinamidine synthase [Taylorella equigenitalis]ASY42126.1 phosphoribosylformylglycinamidine synthase [Taylorella equigenitalis]RBA26440.1 phosphoribosylformylglycinamidine synthase [Taylorella equigenitalis]WDU53964.1 phosphoribosylformylglycinamidine synthase [Taylorella equigenitalis]
MSTHYYIEGSSALSQFQSEKILEKLKKLNVPVSNLYAQYVHFVFSERELDPSEQHKLKSLLTYGKEFLTDQAQENSLILHVVPRIGTISPWASKSTDIAKNCGLSKVYRIERGIKFYFVCERGLLGSKKLSDTQISSIAQVIHDRMTEQVFEDGFDPQILNNELPPKAINYIDIRTNGENALLEANDSLGLALSKVEIEYLLKSFNEIGRNPTDVELMMFAQANSEHCRHKIFNASWIIDGESKEKSLFSMIRDTHKAHPDGTIVAYSDNAAIFSGHEISRFFPDSDSNFKYKSQNRLTHTLIKVETHNHPTAIAPFQGASTGAGGEIRDEGATGRGGKPKAGLVGFTVSNLHLNDLDEIWEKDSHAMPDRIANPKEIMTQGPIGAANFNNEFGRPNLTGYFRVYEQTVDGVRWGYHKPIMIAGGLGSIDDSLTHKKVFSDGTLLIQLGGPGFRIGMGGGAASSMGVGSNSESLDFDSVQRGNPEIQRRAQEVIDTCWRMLDKNPILSIHDVGAGGLSNAFPEMVHDADMGALFDLNKINLEESGMSPAEVWCNESQERYVLAIAPESLEAFSEICARERCPFSVVGIAKDDKDLRVTDAPNDDAVSLPMDVILGSLPKVHKQVTTLEFTSVPLDYVEASIEDLALKVMRHPTVASKLFLITIGDRSVGGLTARDQMVGPWQVPVADCSVTLDDYEGYSGEAMSMGERSPLAIINPASASRMAITEAITNIASADIKRIEDIKLSANWMASSGSDGQDVALYKAVEACSKFCIDLGLSIPVGKDSLSMKTKVADGGDEQLVISPVSLIVSAFANVDDVRKSLTPQLMQGKEDSSVLILIDLGEGRQRLAGSVLSHVLNQYGDQTPDLDNPELLKAFFNAIRFLSAQNLIQSYHDRSDGGLFATVAEMAFAGHVGVSINVDMLVYDEQSSDFGDYKIRPDQVEIQRNESTIRALFNEEAGAVIQVARANRDKVLNILKDFGLSKVTYVVGSLNSTDTIEILRDAKTVASFERSLLGKEWSKVGYNISKNRENPKTSLAEFKRWDDLKDPGMQPKVDFNPQEDICAPFVGKGSKPSIAVLREQGCNSHIEMAWAFDKAGFQAHDVHMTDLLSGRRKLSDFQAIVAVGGFSYGDVLGAGQGWAKTILFNEILATQFTEFFDSQNTIALGVCNGCQMMAHLAGSGMIKGAEHWPAFTNNVSSKFEARLCMVEVMESPSIFFKGMEGMQAPVVVSHGEGYANFGSQGDKGLVNRALRYVNNVGQPTESYPFNPNGSIDGITGVTSVDGRFMIMMPHPERVTRNAMMSWHPENWGPKDTGGDYSPWMRMFMNARVFFN